MKKKKTISLTKTEVQKKWVELNNYRIKEIDSIKEETKTNTRMSDSNQERRITKNDIRRTREDNLRENQYRRNNEEQMNNQK